MAKTYSPLLRGALVASSLALPLVTGCSARGGKTDGEAAESAVGRYDCPSGYFCLWADPNFTGRRDQYGLREGEGALRKGTNDTASSLYNRTNSVVCVHTEGARKGESLCVQPFQRVDDLGATSDKGGFDDRISSLSWQ